VDGMKTLLILFLTLSLQAKEFSNSQILILKKAKEYGKKYNLSYTLQAIVWQESSAGIQRENYLSGCFGIGHIRLRTYLDRHKIKRTYKNQLIYKHLLTYNDRLNLQAMVDELLFWTEVHDGNYVKIWASYFAGYDVKAGLNYARDIRIKINELKKMKL
jgi:hypothetical protein